MGELASRIDASDATRERITAFLGSCAAERERREVLGLSNKQQARLWDLAGDDLLPMDLDFLVPPTASAYIPQTFDGRNSLPVFTRFQKVFYRTNSGEIGGFNNQLLMRVTGPGYYVAETLSKRAGEVAVNYRKTPASKPKGWPPIRSNNRIPSRFIYGGMIDYLRRISDRSAIGRAYRDGTKEMPNWFVLVRGKKLDGLLGYDFWRLRKQDARALDRSGPAFS